MALPASDAFTNTNGTALPTHDANWDTIEGTCEIQGNAAVGNAAADFSVSIWTGDTFDDDQYSEITIALSGSGTMGAGVCVRGVDGGSGAEGYSLMQDSSGLTFLEQLNNGGSSDALVEETLTALGAGEILRLEIEGSTLRGYFDGTEEQNETDATYTAGDAGVAFYDDQGAEFRADSWEGGNLSSGRVMGSIAGQGGLAGAGGLAGQGGGLAA